MYSNESMLQFTGYTTIRLLPPGGMTDIFMARDPKKRPVVIRCLRDEFAQQRKWRKNFIRGAEILQDFDHPNIVRLIELNPDSFPPYMVLEYLNAKTLRSLILAKDTLITDHLLVLLRQMASALYYVHSMGYLHLDFKPDNLLVAEDPHVTLIDFDLITPRSRRPFRVKELGGTLFYLPPEAQRHRRLGERADIYAFGVTAYEMVKFHKPFSGETVEEARKAQLDASTPPTPIQSKETSIHPGLESIILKCLAKVPDDRYPSMSQVLKALDSLA